MQINLFIKLSISSKKDCSIVSSKLIVSIFPSFFCFSSFGNFPLDKFLYRAIFEFKVLMVSSNVNIL